MLKNIEKYNVDYVIMYQDSPDEIISKFLKYNFSIVAELNWNKASDKLNRYKLWKSNHPPKWWLLSCPKADENRLTN